MTPSPGPAPQSIAPRIAPGAIAVLGYWSAIGLTRWLAPGTMTEFFVCLYGPIVAAVVVGIWWTAVSRFPGSTRLGHLALAALTGTAAVLLADRSLSGLVLIIVVLPWVLTAFVAGAAIAARFSPRSRTLLLSATVLACAAAVCAVRLEGVSSALTARLAWRWAATREDAFLAAHSEAASHVASAPSDTSSAPIAESEGDWPGFRGPNRDGVVHNVTLETDWTAQPPRQLWRHPIGPGWSSFAVIGNRLFTQEQRGPDEYVACYDAGAGREVWTHHAAARFDEAISGPGPRGTPSFHEGRLYAFGGSGQLRAFRARDGECLWTRDVKSDVGAETPQYGFAGSPLVADGLVTIFAGGPGGKSVAAYAAEDGQPVWQSGDGTVGYSSVQREEIDGAPHYLCASDTGVTAFEPKTGRILWSNAWQIEKQNRIVQPCRLDGNRLLIGTGLNAGIRLLEIARKGDAWEAKELWTDNTFKPYFNDFVVHQNRAYGYDGSLLSCFDLSTQKRLWKKRGYDSGQMLLLEPQALLLLATEKGEVALLTADPRAPRELGRFTAFNGKSWCHPVFARGRLYLRNSEEMACYELGASSAEPR